MADKLQLCRGSVHCRPGWHGRNPAGPSMGAWQAASQSGWMARLLTFDSECGRRGWSHTIQSVAMASDCSPATSGSAAARSAGGHSPRSSAVQQALIEKSCCTKTLGNRLNFVTRRCKTKQQNGRHLVFAEPAGDSAWHQQQELLSAAWQPQSEGRREDRQRG